MYNVRDISDCDILSILFPALRKINYSDTPQVRFVSTHLRHAWRAPSPADLSDHNAAISASFKRSLAHTADVPRELDSDQNTVHTPWRDALYTMWNHVFWDVAKFLKEAGPGFGHLHPPKHAVFPLTYGTGVRDTQTWDTNVLLCPAVRMDGVVVRVWIGKGEESREVGRFGGPVEKGDASGEGVTQMGETECWFITAGSEVRFFVERAQVPEMGEEGLAAVIVWTPLCQENHRNGDESP
ncbi:hypothetical protein B0H34DRAFT_800735 [Crassisporium funariophilum]|nr:hypothetical protein B0H34DRAFT_800735 [Crassisporium funariophilum]